MNEDIPELGSISDERAKRVVNMCLRAVPDLPSAGPVAD